MTPRGALSRRRLLAGAAALVSAAPWRAWGQQHDHSGHEVDTEVRLSRAAYTVPRLQLVREDGHAVAFPAEFDDGRVVVLNFIFTTCTAICPVTSQVFAEAQKLLAPQARRLHMMSISIDPENDTPARLREYAHRFSAGPQWNHYTGTTAASIEMQRAFNTYRGDKMNHQPVTFLRKARDAQWVRMEGFVAPSDLAAEVRTLLG